ncbi:unnamed protein product [Paramecium sonneborni]|uniref:Uncharacterized protein n=1 Tax=Paramecium sonneborni TaxID=65129 RepID=A0A8S1KMF2_9CILI|nr:unnamed protein product [Paramecium sonneborni]
MLAVITQKKKEKKDQQQLDPFIWKLILIPKIRQKSQKSKKIELQRGRDSAIKLQIEWKLNNDELTLDLNFQEQISNLSVSAVIYSRIFFKENARNILKHIKTQEKEIKQQGNLHKKYKLHSNQIRQIKIPVHIYGQENIFSFITQSQQLQISLLVFGVYIKKISSIFKYQLIYFPLTKKQSKSGYYWSSQLF